MIGVINYHGGNAPSVAAALMELGAEHQLIDEAAHIAKMSHIILPGVGAAKATLDSLGELHMLEPLAVHALEAKKPFLGICVGLQVLFEHSEEDDHTCLGWLKGQVVRFDDALERVPQIGWNMLSFKTKAHPLAAVVPDQSYCYFVNSYHARPTDPDVVLATTDYGVVSTALIAQDNIWASQFHMEKSGPVGLRMLKAFIHQNVAVSDDQRRAS